MFSRSPLIRSPIRRLRPPSLPGKTRAGPRATGPALCWAGTGAEKALGLPRLPGALSSDGQPHGGAGSLEQPRPGIRYQSARAAASGPRAPPALTPTPERGSPGHPWSPAQSAGLERPRALPSRPPPRSGARGAPEAPPASPPSPLPLARPPTRPARRGAALGFREESAARCPWRLQSCPSKWRCARGRQGRAARETPRQPAPCACGRCPSSWSPACCSW